MENVRIEQWLHHLTVIDRGEKHVQIICYSETKILVENSAHLEPVSTLTS